MTTNSNHTKPQAKPTFFGRVCNMIRTIRRHLFEHDGRATEQVAHPTDDGRKESNHAQRSPSGEHSAINERQLLNLICELSNAIWRIKKRTNAFTAEDDFNVRMLKRQISSAELALHSAKVEIKDPCGEEYVPGSALRVVAYQPTPGTERETIIETIRPSVFFSDNLIQWGEVVVATPTSVLQSSEEKPSVDSPALNPQDRLPSATELQGEQNATDKTEQ